MLLGRGGGFPIEEIESNVDVVTSHVGGGGEMV